MKTLLALVLVTIMLTGIVAGFLPFINPEVNGLLTPNDNTVKRHQDRSFFDNFGDNYSQIQNLYAQKFNSSDLINFYHRNCPIPEKLVNGTCSTTTPTPTNKPPVITVTSPVTGKVNVEVKLTASVSDPDGAVEKVIWNQESGATVDFTSTVNSLTFIPTVADKYVFSIEAQDDKGAAALKSVTVNVGTNIPDPTPGSVPALDTNKNFRVCAVADVDDNSGLDTEAKLMKKYGCQVVVIAGDLDYNNIKGVWTRLAAQGFTKDNLVVVAGNHDQCSDIQAFLGTSSCEYQVTFNSGKVDFFNYNGPSSCSSSLNNKLESSDAWYNIPVIHEPWATVKSDHGPNGQFSCQQPIFKNNGVLLAIQGHNHNYQWGVVDGIGYLVAGTGTHDTGSSMYGCDSTTFNSVTFKCITGTNGAVIMDLQIDNPQERHISGYFVSSSDKLVHTFSNGGSQ